MTSEHEDETKDTTEVAESRGEPQETRPEREAREQQAIDSFAELVPPAEAQHRENLAALGEQAAGMRERGDVEAAELTEDFIRRAGGDPEQLAAGAADAQHRENLAALGEQAAGMRERGDVEAAELNEDFIRRAGGETATTADHLEPTDVPVVTEQWESEQDVPDHIRERLHDDELDAMSFPLEYEKGPAPPGESFTAYTHHDWPDDVPGTEREPVEGTMDDVLHRRLNWASPAGVEEDDQTIDATYDIQESARRAGIPVDVETIRREPDGADALEIDVRESRALKPEHDTPPPDYERDTSWPLDAPFPGGAPQVRLLDYDPASCDVVIEPVGETVDLREPTPRYDYPDRTQFPEKTEPRQARDEARNARVTMTFRPGAVREVIRSRTAPQRSRVDRRGA